MRLTVTGAAFVFDDLPASFDPAQPCRIPGVSWGARERALRVPAPTALQVERALAAQGVRLADDEVRAEFARALRADPAWAAAALAASRDPRAAPEIARALDAFEGGLDCAVCDHLAVQQLAWALDDLGVPPTAAQAAKVEAFRLRQVGEWRSASPDALSASPYQDLAALPRIAPPAGRAPRLGRNDACPCGSGRKYKRCHLGADALGAHGSPTRDRGSLGATGSTPVVERAAAGHPLRRPSSR